MIVGIVAVSSYRGRLSIAATHAAVDLLVGVAEELGDGGAGCELVRVATRHLRRFQSPACNRSTQPAPGTARDCAEPMGSEYLTLARRCRCRSHAGDDRPDAARRLWLGAYHVTRRTSGTAARCLNPAARIQFSAVRARRCPSRGSGRGPRPFWSVFDLCNVTVPAVRLRLDIGRSELLRCPTPKEGIEPTMMGAVSCRLASPWSSVWRSRGPRRSNRVRALGHDPGPNRIGRLTRIIWRTPAWANGSADPVRGGLRDRGAVNTHRRRRGGLGRLDEVRSASFRIRRPCLDAAGGGPRSAGVPTPCALQRGGRAARVPAVRAPDLGRARLVGTDLRYAAGGLR